MHGTLPLLGVQSPYRQMEVPDGLTIGLLVGLMLDGVAVGILEVGSTVGLAVGATVGAVVDGENDGDADFVIVGEAVGTTNGPLLLDGNTVGMVLGPKELNE